mmetsp:Transcript_30351/g.77183  ORF Transcript_30351/g.77183 Transcript_30351/m.77183 type:complete len:203 (+) Transcript_30351:460-1068(+)
MPRLPSWAESSTPATPCRIDGGSVAAPYPTAARRTPSFATFGATQKQSRQPTAQSHAWPSGTTKNLLPSPSTVTAASSPGSSEYLCWQPCAKLTRTAAALSTFSFAEASPQQSRRVPPIVLQHSPTSPSAAHLGWDAQAELVRACIRRGSRKCPAPAARPRQGRPSRRTRIRAIVAAHSPFSNTKPATRKITPCTLGWAECT